MRNAVNMLPFNVTKMLHTQVRPSTQTQRQGPYAKRTKCSERSNIENDAHEMQFGPAWAVIV